MIEVDAGGRQVILPIFSNFFVLFFYCTDFALICIGFEGN